MNKDNAIGQKYNKLFVESLAGKNAYGCQLASCICDCGKHKTTRLTDVIAGRVQSCGCLQREHAKSLGLTRRKDLTGITFGKLTPFRINGKNKFGNILWDCICECGNIATVVESALVSGNTQSCGCLVSQVARNRKNRNDHIGERHGRLVIERLNIEKSYKGKQKYVYFDCVCDCGKKVTKTYAKILSTKSCGCLNQENRRANMKLNISVGEVFYDLTVIKEIEKEYKSGTSIKYVCLCSCGETVLVPGTALVSGTRKRCSERKHKEMDFIGTVHCFLTVICKDTLYVDPSGRHTKWICKCKCGTIKSYFKHSLLQGTTKSCGCIKSLGEATICNLLTEKNIEYIHGYSFNDLIGPNGGLLEFDFAIFKNNKLNYLIEYQGRQHYEAPKSRPNFGKLEREITDKQKKEYCKTNNISLYEIKYNENIEIKLNEIICTHVNPVGNASA